MILHRLGAALALSSSFLVACSNDGNVGAGGFGGAGSGAGDAGSGSGHGGSMGAGTSAGGSGGGIFAGAGGGSSQGGAGTAVIYANTDTTLFQLDPTSPSLTLTQIGDFDCIDPNGAGGKDTAMTDIAVDANENIWGVTGHAVHPLTVQGSTVHCGPEVTFSDFSVRFYALTFAPKGVLSPNLEVLVAGNTAGELWAIDAKGKVSQHGKFGVVPADDGHGHTYANPGKLWELSGDVVFLANGGHPVGFATVRDCPNPPDTTGCSDVNTLLEIDVPKIATAGSQNVTKYVRGQIVKRAGCTDTTNGDYGNMYGIAAWNDKVYGFSRYGNLVAVDISDGTGCLVHSYPTSLFAGAGVTTLAPVIVMPPS